MTGFSFFKIILINEKKVIIAPVDSQATCVYIYKTRLVKTNNKFQDRRARCEK